MKIFSFLTGHTCGDHCWHARELVCRCSCGGANHGILLKGGERPQRTRKIDGHFYELVSIVAHDGKDCQSATYKKVQAEVNRITDERFPNLTWLGYGEWRHEKRMPVLDLAISESQSRWEEVVAIKGALRLVWARPVGTDYLVQNDARKIVYASTIPKSAESSVAKAQELEVAVI